MCPRQCDYSRHFVNNPGNKFLSKFSCSLKISFLWKEVPVGICFHRKALYFLTSKPLSPNLVTAYSKDLLEGSSCIGMTSTLLVLGLAGDVGGWLCQYLVAVTGTPLAGDGPGLGENLYVSTGEIKLFNCVLSSLSCSLSAVPLKKCLRSFRLLRCDLIL